MKEEKVIPLIFDTYLAVIKNSVGFNMFRQAYAEIDGKKTDIMKDGELSCAFFVSSVLTLSGFIKKVRATVDSTVKELKEADWQELKKPKVGSILVWEEMDFGDSDIHQHIGFYMGNHRAISNDSKSGQIIEHHYTSEGKRNIKNIFHNLDFL